MTQHIATALCVGHWCARINHLKSDSRNANLNSRVTPGLSCNRIRAVGWHLAAQTRGFVSQKDRTMSTTIIPAQPGFRARWTDPDTGKECEEPILAWELTYSYEYARCALIPLGVSGDCNDDAEIIGPGGKVVSK